MNVLWFTEYGGVIVIYYDARCDDSFFIPSFDDVLAFCVCSLCATLSTVRRDTYGREFA